MELVPFGFPLTRAETNGEKEKPSSKKALTQIALLTFPAEGYACIWETKVCAGPSFETHGHTHTHTHTLTVSK